MPAWRQVYRSLEHGFAKKACSDKRVLRKFPQNVQNFANSFATMQEKRHSADYDPAAPTVLKSDVVQDIQMAERVLTDFRDVPIKDRRAFAAHVLLKRRS